jgi:hypothetical protein
MERVKVLLASTSLTVGSIVQETGFFDLIAPERHVLKNDRAESPGIPVAVLDRNVVRK